MDAASTISSFHFLTPKSIPGSCLLRKGNTCHAFPSSSPKELACSFPCSFSGGEISSNCFDLKFGSKRLSMSPLPRFPSRNSVITMVIPFTKGKASEQPPPDLPSYLFKNRIVYLGMSLVPSVTELILAEFLYLQYEDNQKPIYFYINSTGITKGGQKLGYETEALATYDIMSYIKAPIFTLCVGNAWGEAALLLAAGAPGNRAALPSSTIMIKQPIARFQGQASDVEIARREIKNVKMELNNLMAKHTGKTPEQIEEDTRRPKYFSPSEAVEYGIIDKVVYNEKSSKDTGFMSDLKRAQLI